MHVISDIKANGTLYISDNWPDWDAVMDDMKTLHDIGYIVYSTKLGYQFVIVLVDAPLRPVLS